MIFFFLFNSAIPVNTSLIRNRGRCEHKIVLCDFVDIKMCSKKTGKSFQRDSFIFFN